MKETLRLLWIGFRNFCRDTNVQITDFDWANYQAIRRLIERGPEVDEGSIKAWVEKYIPCHCDEAYTSRGLRAPDCPRHAWVDVPELKQFLQEVTGVTVKERK
jgi:hypothetical protein